MSLNPEILPDKIIVDRRKAHRNSDVARAIRRSREMLIQKSDNPDFERDMLHMHAKAMIGGSPVAAFLIFMVGTAAFFLGASAWIAVWAVIASLTYAGISLYSRKLVGKEIASIEIVKTRRLFLLGHVAAGLSWAVFMAVGCQECNPAYFSVFKSAVLLMTIGATAVMAYALSGAVVFAFFVPVFVFLIETATAGDQVRFIMGAMLVLAIPFFSVIARNMHGAARMFISYRAEKDHLIAELETAKALSDEARLRAEEANLAKSRFLASMSHELRTPLNAILGFSEVMSNEVLGPINNDSYREYANDIHSSGEHLLRLINEILDLSRIEAGKREISEQAINLADIIDEACRMLDIKIRGKKLNLECKFQPDLPSLWADEKSVRQIALNLLSNAVKFTPTGGRIAVHVGWTAGGGQYLSIKDNGPGIPEDEIPVVLSAFGQGSIAIKSAEQGTGLGLTIVQALMKLHDGRMDLKSRLREGTTVTVVFPKSRVLGARAAETTRADARIA